MAYLAVVTVLTLIHGFALGWQLPLDLAVYERGGADSVSGEDDLYRPLPGQLPFTYPPLAALLFAPLHVLPAPLTMLVVAWLSYASLATLVMVGLFMAPGIDPRLGPLATVAAALLEPVAETLRFGQVNLALAALIAVDLLVVPRRWRGLLLAVAISIKLTPGIFLLVPWARRDWGTLVRAVSATLALSAAPMLLLPHSWYDFWFRAIRDPQRVGGVEYLSNQSISGAAWRLTGEGGVPLVVLAMQLGVVAVAAFAMMRARSRDPLASVLIAAVAGLLVSPISWIHHWVWVTLLVPWFVLNGLRPGRSPRWLRIAMLSTALGWLLVTATRLVWLAPDGNHLEYSAGTALKLLSASYTILGLTSLALLARHLWVPANRRAVAAGERHADASGAGGAAHDPTVLPESRVKLREGIGSVENERRTGPCTGEEGPERNQRQLVGGLDAGPAKLSDR